MQATSEPLSAIQEMELALAAGDQIDTSDIPEQTDWSDARRGVFFRPAELR